MVDARAEVTLEELAAVAAVEAFIIVYDHRPLPLASVLEALVGGLVARCTHPLPPRAPIALGRRPTRRRSFSGAGCAQRIRLRAVERRHLPAQPVKSLLLRLVGDKRVDVIDRLGAAHVLDIEPLLTHHLLEAYCAHAHESLAREHWNGWNGCCRSRQ